jgi:hypothetical protein
MLIFLDFDGVLRRTTSPLYTLDADLVQRFKQWVLTVEEKRGSVEIVITSTWKDAFSLDTIRGMVGLPFALRIRGTTEGLNRCGEHQRYQEILAYLERTKSADVPWLAIDDQPEHFPPALRASHNLLLCDPTVGFAVERNGGLQIWES